ncbi:cell wall anchor protein [Haloflavibacter putidus]|nr:cell wall anchor protein [Haloflavibacter putidus]
MKKRILLIFLLSFPTLMLQAQVGINTTEPDKSASLDIQSQDSGLLVPRMTTAQREAIVDPANSLLVYDTDLDGYYYNQGTKADIQWVKFLNSEKNARDNFKIIKKESDFPEASGGKITLDENVLYEINGSVAVNTPIDLNGAYLSGKNTNRDILINNTGSSLFTGNKGGVIRNMIINGNGNQLFQITGTGVENLILNNLFFTGAGSIGKLEGFNLVLLTTVQFLNNQNGLEAVNIYSFLLSNIFWTEQNDGTFLSLNGTFTDVQYSGGRVVTDAGETGIDVSSNPTINNSASIDGVNFSGSGTRVNGYTTNSYPNYNFDNKWEVNTAGITREEDAVANASMFYQGSAVNSNYNSSSGTKLNVITQVTNRLLFSHDNNELTYNGLRGRTFQLNGSLSYSAADAPELVFYVVKKNSSEVVALNNTKVFSKGSTGFFTNSGTLAVPLHGTVRLQPGESVEVWVQANSGSGTMNIRSFNLSIN